MWSYTFCISNNFHQACNIFFGEREFLWSSQQVSVNHFLALIMALTLVLISLISALVNLITQLMSPLECEGALFNQVYQHLEIHNTIHSTGFIIFPRSCWLLGYIFSFQKGKFYLPLLACLDFAGAQRRVVLTAVPSPLAHFSQCLSARWNVRITLCSPPAREDLTFIAPQYLSIVFYS